MGVLVDKPAPDFNVAALPGSEKIVDSQKLPQLVSDLALGRNA